MKPVEKAKSNQKQFKAITENLNCLMSNGNVIAFYILQNRFFIYLFLKSVASKLDVIQEESRELR